MTRAAAPYAFQAQQNAIGAVPALAAAEYGDITALGNVGATEQAMEQARIGEDIDRWNFGENRQAVKLDQLTRLLAGAPGGTITSGTQNIVGAPAANPYTTAIGGALGAASAAGNLGWRPFSK
jgi:hypothetical protein